MKKKIVIGIVSVALVLCMVISGTIAYLTSTPDSVKNVFVMGANIDVDFTEKETDNVDKDGNHVYKVLPDQDITKTAVVTVKTGSDACYLFVELDKTDNFDEYLEYTINPAWTELDILGLENPVFYMSAPAATEKDAEYHVFKDDKLKVKADVESIDDDLAVEIFVGAIQNLEGDGLDDAVEAWSALTGETNTLTDGSSAPSQEKKKLGDVLPWFVSEDELAESSTSGKEGKISKTAGALAVSYKPDTAKITCSIPLATRGTESSGTYTFEIGTAKPNATAAKVVVKEKEVAVTLTVYGDKVEESTVYNFTFKPETKALSELLTDVPLYNNAWEDANNNKFYDYLNVFALDVEEVSSAVEGSWGIPYETIMTKQSDGCWTGTVGTVGEHELVLDVTLTDTELKFDVSKYEERTFDFLTSETFTFTLPISE